jgi:hypothetical protein
MTRDEYGDLLAEIGGGSQIGIAARRERDAAEVKTLAEHEEKFWALLCLGDALHQFYRDTMDRLSVRIAAAPLGDEQIAMAQWHLVSFNRFAAAFDLMAHGYYFEAMVLARDLWEVAVSLAGIKRNVVTLAELLATGAATPREAETLCRSADQKIRRALIRDNAALTDAGREAVETFVGIANLAMHKSKLHFGLNLSRTAKGQPIPIFPHFDLERAGAAHNVLYLATWSIISTLPYLDFALSKADTEWEKHYGKVQLAFREGPGRGPNPVVKAWPEVIQGVFGT